MSPKLSRGGGRRSVAVFVMPENGHLQRLSPLIAGLSEAGLRTHVFTHAAFQAQVERAGGVFFDLFGRWPLERSDDESIPVPSRYVTYAATYAEQVRREVERTGASLIVHDTFAVIGRVAASLLGLPRVNVCAGHNMSPARTLAALSKDPRVRTSRACFEAVKILRESYGIEDASPFSYVSSLSPTLNIYSEPPEFLDVEERSAFEPVAFYGSLPAGAEREKESRPARRWFPLKDSATTRLYVSFGTVVWKYYAGDADRALSAIARALNELGQIRTIISLGGAGAVPSALRGRSAPNISVEDYVDQWELLKEADAFITHHGLNSTHEAIFRRVPMISYPFFTDQPEQAEKCRRFGIAVPLADAPRGAFDDDCLRAALARLAAERESMRAALNRAREWELAVLAGRPAVHRRIRDLTI